ncbi:hypothetical protein Glove_30g151 [Diversispora epigaea]|uniref:Uncharacterized protein n=1 Tax=Diversispora epigaea TaxID=1348612 RepID=A0A397JLY8_9GLOM|nr:hypothetical protein Glove_30g151 [Diversispora epigaea]
MSSQDDINQNWQKIENDIKVKLIKFLQSDEESISLDINNTIEPHAHCQPDICQFECGLKSKMHVAQAHVSTALKRRYKCRTPETIVV